MSALAADPKGKTVASVGNDRAVRFWSFADGEATRAAAFFDGPPHFAVTWSPDGKWLASCGSSSIYVWDAVREEAKPTRLVAGHDVRGVSFAPDNSTLVSASDNTIRLWDTKNARELLPNTSKKVADIRTLAFSRDGQVLITGGWDRTLRVWEFGSLQPTERKVIDLPPADGVVDVLALSPDGKVLATGGSGHILRLWEVRHVELVTGPLLRGHNQAVTALAFSPDGKRLASGSDDGFNPLRLWDVAGNKLRERSSFPGYRVAIRSVAFLSDSKHLASAGRDPATRVWDVETDKSVEFNPLKGVGILWVNALAAAPENKRLAVATSDRAVRVWDQGRAENQEPVTLAEPGGPFMPNTFGLSFSPDGRFLAGAQEGRIILWDVNAKKQVWEHALPGNVYQVAFAPDGHHLASVNGNGTVYIFRLPGIVLR